MSSARGRSTRDTTVPGRTHDRRRGGSPGATPTSVRPATQPALEAEDEVAGAGLSAGVLRVGVLLVDVLLGGSVERFPDTLPAAPPPGDAPQAARTTTPATIHPADRHRIPVPPSCPDSQHAPPPRRKRRTRERFPKAEPPERCLTGSAAEAGAA
ncbi:hypothetical protein C3492_38015 [Streptomyces sp. Ru62]|nr:hypothetical protein C3492_38015 [Streptomyces sp. Ru62]